MQTQPCRIQHIFPVYKRVVYRRRKKKAITPEAILDDMCMALERSKEMVVGKSRKRYYATGRQIYFFVAKKITGRSHRELADLVNRDHTTSIHSIKKVKNYFKTNDALFMNDWGNYLSNSRLFNENNFK